MLQAGFTTAYYNNLCSLEGLLILYMTFHLYFNMRPLQHVTNILHWIDIFLEHVICCLESLCFTVSL
jgi:hypothetical protein